MTQPNPEQDTRIVSIGVILLGITTVFLTCWLVSLDKRVDKLDRDLQELEEDIAPFITPPAVMDFDPEPHILPARIFGNRGVCPPRPPFHPAPLAPLALPVTPLPPLDNPGQPDDYGWGTAPPRPPTEEDGYPGNVTMEAKEGEFIKLELYGPDFVEEHKLKTLIIWNAGDIIVAFEKGATAKGFVSTLPFTAERVKE